MAITRSMSARRRLLETETKRRRIDNAPDHSCNSDQAVQIWLDLLPQEVCDSIARVVSEGDYSTDSLHLALVSPVQSRAMVTALAHHYFWEPIVVGCEIAWMHVFMHGVRQVSLPGSFACYASKTLRIEASMLLPAPTLRSVTMPDDPELVRAIARSSSVDELTLLLQDNGPSPMEATRHLMQSLAYLPLLKLTLRCFALMRSTCPLTRIEGLQDSPHALARCCPDLSAFQVAGCDHGFEGFWTMWSTLPRIREVVINRCPPEWVIPRLSTLQAVKISNMDQALPFASRLGASVTHLENQAPVASGTEIAALSECVNMSKMDLHLEEGTECSLPGAVCAMPSLQSLTGNWFSLTRGYLLAYLYMRLGSTRELKFYIPRYIDVTPGVMLCVVRQAPLLTCLNITSVRIRASETVEILKHIGSRLRHFGVSFTGQEESSADRFKTILETIIEHNRGLRTVSVTGARIPSFLHIDEIEENVHLTTAQSALVKNRKNMLRILLRRVKKFVPFLEARNLKSWINAVLWADGCDV